jgi:hypothetical protein
MFAYGQTVPNTEPYQALLNASTQCQGDTNPLVAMKALGGNRLIIDSVATNEKGGYDFQITVTAVYAPTLQAFQGSLKLHTEIPDFHGSLICQVAATPAPSGPPDFSK